MDSVCRRGERQEERRGERERTIILLRPGQCPSSHFFVETAFDLQVEQTDQKKIIHQPRRTNPEPSTHIQKKKKKCHPQPTQPTHTPTPHPPSRHRAITATAAAGQTKTATSTSQTRSRPPPSPCASNWVRGRILPASSRFPFTSSRAAFPESSFARRERGRAVVRAGGGDGGGIDADFEKF